VQGEVVVQFDDAIDYDDWLLKVAQRVPGFAGVYLAEDGELEVMLTDVSRKASAMAAIEPIIADFGRPVEGRARKAEFSFEELVAYRNRVLASSKAIEMLTMMDIDERLNRLVVGVAHAEEIPAMEQELDVLSVPTSGREVGVSRLIDRHQDITETLDTVVGGLLIEHYDPGIGECTLGFNALYNGQLAFTTASHCSSTEGALDPVDRWGQHRISRLIGYEHADPPYLPWVYVPGCPAWQRCRRSDVTVGLYEPGVDAVAGYIARTYETQGSITIDPSNPNWVVHHSGGWRHPPLGLDIWMIGSVSGYQEGEIIRTCALTRSITTGNWLVCQAAGDYESDIGDSGAPILAYYLSGPYVRIVGTHVGANEAGDSAAFSPWQGIEDDFAMIGGSFDEEYSGSPPPPPPPLEGVTISAWPASVQPNDVCTWFGSVTDGTPPYYFRWYKGGQLLKTETATTTEVTFNVGTSSFVLKLTAVDDGGRSGEKTKTITISGGAEQCFQ
jgi:hypothetical protein